MRVFRMPTPPHRTLWFLRAASTSATPPPPFTLPKAPVSSKLKDKNSGAAGSSVNSIISNSTAIENWKSSSLFDSLFPEDALRPGGRNPIGRLDISEDSTYLPDQAEEPVERVFPKRLKRVSSVHWFTDRPSELQSGQKAPADGKQPTTRTAPVTIPEREEVSLVILKGVGTTMLGSDIRRLLSQDHRLPGHGLLKGIVNITPLRHPKTLLQREGYQIIFSDAAAATNFVYTMHPQHTLSNPPTRNLKILPPASTPRFSLPVASAESVRNDLRMLHGTLYAGGCSPGSCVLLLASGLGGRTKETGRLPRTAEVRQMLEEADVAFCPRDQEEGSAGLCRIIHAKRTEYGLRIITRSYGTATGAEGKWIVRCRDPAEAHRVVREWHCREFHDGLGRFMAEMIY